MRLRQASDDAKRGLPATYKHPRFYVIAFVTALIAGGLAVLEDPNKPLLAFEIGVAAPFIIQSIQRKPPALRPPED